MQYAYSINCKMYLKPHRYIYAYIKINYSLKTEKHIKPFACNIGEPDIL